LYNNYYLFFLINFLINTYILKVFMMNLATNSPLVSVVVSPLFNAPPQLSIPTQIVKLQGEEQALIQTINQVRDRTIWEFVSDLVINSLTGFTTAERNHCHLAATRHQIRTLNKALEQGHTTVTANALEIMREQALYANLNRIKQLKATNLG
jgi:hypothetical protein